MAKDRASARQCRGHCSRKGGLHLAAMPSRDWSPVERARTRSVLIIGAGRGSRLQGLLLHARDAHRVQVGAACGFEQHGCISRI
jgi:hypothetical protein